MNKYQSDKQLAIKLGLKFCLDDNHEMEFEFKQDHFPRGWRGDSWCKKCTHSVYSSEAMRMQIFGLARISNPPGSPSKVEYFFVQNLKVKADI